ncbi:unnamed protein product, partial [marine sediment metagenome]
PGTRVVNRIITGAMTLGRICRVSILEVEQPTAFAASTYTFSLTPTTALLTILEPVMPHDIPKTTIIVHILGPMMDIMTIRRINPGMHIQASTILCVTRSNLPPIYADNIPATTEIIVAR